MSASIANSNAAYAELDVCSSGDGAFAAQPLTVPEFARGISSQAVAPCLGDRRAGTDALALRRLELVRLVTRVAPMLGLVATMIPMGPALKALADGQMAEVSRSLMVAFSAVILALIAAAITYAVAQVRRRWYAADMLSLASDEELMS